MRSCTAGESGLALSILSIASSRSASADPSSYGKVRRESDGGGAAELVPETLISALSGSIVEGDGSVKSKCKCLISWEGLLHTHLNLVLQKAEGGIWELQRPQGLADSDEVAVTWRG